MVDVLVIIGSGGSTAAVLPVQLRQMAAKKTANAEVIIQVKLADFC